MSEWKEYKLRDLSDIYNHERVPLNSIEREANNKICFLERKVKELKINNKIIKCILVAAVLMVEGVRDVKSEIIFEGSRSDPE